MAREACGAGGSHGLARSTGMRKGLACRLYVLLISKTADPLLPLRSALRVHQDIPGPAATITIAKWHTASMLFFFQSVKSVTKPSVNTSAPFTRFRRWRNVRGSTFHARSAMQVPGRFSSPVLIDQVRLAHTRCTTHFEEAR